MSYSRKIHKITGILTFLILLASAVILIAYARNLSLEYADIGISINTVYFLSGIIIFLSVVHLIQVISLTTERVYREEYTQKSELREIYDIENEKSPQNETQEKEEEYNIEEIGQKILPKEAENITHEEFYEKILQNIANEYDIVQGLFYNREKDSDTFSICSKYAYYGEEEPRDFQLGISLSGQTAKNQKVMNIQKIPENYMTILSGLGSGSPKSLLLVPVIHDGKTIGLIELASFKDFDKKTEKIFNDLSNLIGNELATKIT